MTRLGRRLFLAFIWFFRQWRNPRRHAPRSIPEEQIPDFYFQLNRPPKDLGH